MATIDAISLLIIVLKATGCLQITWPQALALPIFLFLLGAAEELVSIFRNRGSNPTNEGNK